MVYKCNSTQLIRMRMLWDGIETNYHHKYNKQLEVTPTIKAYTYSLSLKKKLEAISLEHEVALI